MSFRDWTRGAWAGVIGVIAVLAVVIGIAVAVSADDENAGPTSSPQVSEQDSPSSTPSSTPSSSPTKDKPELPPEIDYRDAAKRAAQGGLAPFVPDGRTWVVTKADYRDGSWQLVVEDGVTQAQVIQTSGVEPAALVSRHVADAREGAAVNLGRWQLGEWRSWAAPSQHALSREFTHGVVLVTGTDAEAVRSATQSLLTFETPRGGEQD